MAWKTFLAAIMGPVDQDLLWRNEYRRKAGLADVGRLCRPQVPETLEWPRGLQRSFQ